MNRIHVALLGFVACLNFTSSVPGQVAPVLQGNPDKSVCPSPARIAPGSKLYVADMNGFEVEMKNALSAIPSIDLVDSKEDADFVVTGSVKMVARHRGAFYFDTSSPAEAEMTVEAVRDGQRAYYHHLRIRFAGDGSRDAAKALAKHFHEFMARQN